MRIRWFQIEQNPYVGVYGAAHLQKKSLFEDLMKYLERPGAFATSSKFKVARFEFESVTSLDDCIDELFEQGLSPALMILLSSRVGIEQISSVRVLGRLNNNPRRNIYSFSPIHKTVWEQMYFISCWTVNRSRRHVSNCATVEKIIQVRIERSSSLFTRSYLESTTIYYFPSVFHIFVTMSKRTWSTENDIYKKFKWIPFKIDSVPWNGLLKRHLWRRMIDT